MKGGKEKDKSSNVLVFYDFSSNVKFDELEIFSRG